MKMKTGAIVLALTMLATGAAYALPPNIPAGASATDIGPDPLNSCNNGGPSAPQALGYGGSAAGSAGTGYHRYASDQAIGGLDACLGLGGVPVFATCAATTEENAV